MMALTKKSLRELVPGNGFRTGSTEGIVLHQDRPECTTTIYFRQTCGYRPHGVSLWSDSVVVSVVPVHPLHLPGELLDRYGIKVGG